jgi:hypothetical protein
MPTMDEGFAWLQIASGTSLGETDRLLQQVETILGPRRKSKPTRDEPDSTWGGVTEANTGDFFIRLDRSRAGD